MEIIRKSLGIIKNEGIKSFINKIYLHFNNLDKKEYYKWIKENTPSKKEIKDAKKF